MGEGMPSFFRKYPFKIILLILCKVPGLQPVSGQPYPLLKTMSVVVKPPVAPNVRHFIDYVLSPRGKRILEQSGNMAVAHDKE